MYSIHCNLYTTLNLSKFTVYSMKSFLCLMMSNIEPGPWPDFSQTLKFVFSNRKGGLQ